MTTNLPQSMHMASTNNSILTAQLNEIYQLMRLPYAHTEFGDEYDKELAAAKYIWKIGSYRCGITAHIVFFLLGDLVETGARANVDRFGKLLNFAKSFDFTDVFIKKVTASGRGKAKADGLRSTEV